LRHEVAALRRADHDVHRADQRAYLWRCDQFRWLRCDQFRWLRCDHFHLRRRAC
jgi:hypothetical protein